MEAKNGLQRSCVVKRVFFEVLGDMCCGQDVKTVALRDEGTVWNGHDQKSDQL